MPATPEPKLQARLRHPELLRGAMRYAGLSVRELSEACGSMSYRSAIGHLLSGRRDTCPAQLAAKIERRLHLPAFNLFDLLVTTTVNVGPTAQNNRRKAA